MRFTIKDQLVRGKLVRFRCRQCLATLEAHLPSKDPPPLTLIPTDPPRPPPPLPRTSPSAPPPLRLPQWVVSTGDTITGPMNLAGLRAHIQQGNVLPTDLVWRAGLEGWIPISAAYELSGAITNMAPLAQNPSQSLMAFNPAETSNLVAIQPAPASGFFTLQTPLPLSPPPRHSQWPLWIALFGGLMMMLAVATFFYLGRQDRVVTTTKLEPNTHQLIRKSLPATTPSRGARPLVYSRSASPAGHTSPAFQIFRAKQNLLYTCDKIAKERGELPPENSTTEFKVQIPAQGPPRIQIIGEHLSSMTLDCYQTVISQWKIPSTAKSTSFSFLHHH